MWSLFTALANPYLPTQPVPAAVEQDPFVWEVPALSASPIELVLTVPSGYAVYRDEIGIRATQGTLGEPVFPEPVLRADPSDPTTIRALYDGPVRILVPAEAGEIELVLTHQGCRKGLCWPRSETTKKVTVWKK